MVIFQANIGFSQYIVPFISTLQIPIAQEKKRYMFRDYRLNVSVVKGRLKSSISQ